MSVEHQWFIHMAQTLEKVSVASVIELHASNIGKCLFNTNKSFTGSNIRKCQPLTLVLFSSGTDASYHIFISGCLSMGFCR